MLCCLHLTMTAYMKIENMNLSANLIFRVTGITTLLFCCLFLQSAHAEKIDLKLPSGISVAANYHAGKPGMPTVLLLHGFLQTHNSPPTSTLAANLASKGYTLLNPTISLGINKRSQSLACEAVHTHKLQDEQSEIDFWLKWLIRKNHQNIALVGFSSNGNLNVLEYISHSPIPEVKKAILIGFNPINFDLSERQEARADVEQKQIDSSKDINNFSMGYCKNNYTATVDSYLSYAQYDENRLLQLLKQSHIAADIILGSDDTILPAPWLAMIKALPARNRIITISNANHFFDGTSEFDLSEEVEKLLQSIPTK